MLRASCSVAYSHGPTATFSISFCELVELVPDSLNILDAYATYKTSACVVCCCLWMFKYRKMKMRIDAVVCLFSSIQIGSRHSRSVCSLINHRTARTHTHTRQHSHSPNVGSWRMCDERKSASQIYLHAAPAEQWIFVLAGNVANGTNNITIIIYMLYVPCLRFRTNDRRFKFTIAVRGI